MYVGACILRVHWVLWNLTMSPWHTTSMHSVPPLNWSAALLFQNVDLVLPNQSGNEIGFPVLFHDWIPSKLANTNLPSRVLLILVIMWYYPDVSLGLVVVAASRYVGYFNSFTLSCTVSALYAQSRSRQEFLALLFNVSQHLELCPLCLFRVSWIWLLASFSYQCLCHLCFF